MLPAPTTSAVVAGRDLGQVDAVDGDRDRFQQRGLGERKAVGQAMDDPRRHGDQLGEGAGAAVVAARDAQHLPAVAQVDGAAAAVRAVAAVDRGVEGDPIADREIADGVAARRDRAGRFVSHDDRRDAPARRAVVAVHVAAADAARGDAHQDLVGRGRRRGQVGDLEVSVAGQQQGLHRVASFADRAAAVKSRHDGARFDSTGTSCRRATARGRCASTRRCSAGRPSAQGRQRPRERHQCRLGTVAIGGGHGLAGTGPRSSVLDAAPRGCRRSSRHRRRARVALGARVLREPAAVPGARALGGAGRSARRAVRAARRRAAAPSSAPARASHGRILLGRAADRRRGVGDRVLRALTGRSVESIDMGPLGIYRILVSGGRRIAGVMKHPENRAPALAAVRRACSDVDADTARAVELGASLYFPPREHPGRRTRQRHRRSDGRRRLSVAGLARLRTERDPRDVGRRDTVRRCDRSMRRCARKESAHASNCVCADCRCCWSCSPVRWADRWCSLTRPATNRAPSASASGCPAPRRRASAPSASSA